MNIRKFFKLLFFLTLGGLLAAVAISIFLVPNKIIDGGVLGVSIITSFIVNKNLGANVSLGLFTFIMNLPFIFFALKKFGKGFIISAAYAIGIMSIAIAVIEHNSLGVATKDPILACLFGGLILGIGVGLVLKSNGCLDGTEIISIEISKKTGYSVGEIVMFFNIFIFSAAGFIFGWDSAMYSMLTYFIAYQFIDIVIDGLEESRSIWIISDYAEKIGHEIIDKMNLSVTYLSAVGGYSGKPKNVIYCVTTRIGLVKLKEIVKETDPSAFISVVNVSEVEGKRIKNKKKF